MILCYAMPSFIKNVHHASFVRRESCWYAQRLGEFETIDIDVRTTNRVAKFREFGEHHLSQFSAIFRCIMLKERRSQSDRFMVFRLGNGSEDCFHKLLRSLKEIVQTMLSLSCHDAQLRKPHYAAVYIPTASLFNFLQDSVKFLLHSAIRHRQVVLDLRCNIRDAPLFCANNVGRHNTVFKKGLLVRCGLRKECIKRRAIDPVFQLKWRFALDKNQIVRQVSRLLTISQLVSVFVPFGAL